LAIVTPMRGADIDIPVLMVSALSDVDERIRGLRAGGDDYMTKPFASEELTARFAGDARQADAWIDDPHGGPVSAERSAARSGTPTLGLGRIAVLPRQRHSSANKYALDGQVLLVSR